MHGDVVVVVELCALWWDGPAIASNSARKCCSRAIGSSAGLPSGLRNATVKTVARGVVTQETTHVSRMADRLGAR
jgi:hypothetical protein